MVGIAIATLAFFVPFAIILIIKGIRQGDELDKYNTPGKTYIIMAIFCLIFAIGVSTFCFIKNAEYSRYDYSYSSDNSGYSGSSSSGGSFTNKYGDRTTKCFVSGCNNYIARSGDTNCCTTHSNKCLECHCYIDRDAMYCMSCLSGALGGNSGSSKSKSCYICGDSAYSKYGSYYYCSDCLALVKAFSD